MTPASSTPAPPDRRRATRRSTKRTRRWTPTPLLWFTVVVALIGATVLVYSPTARWFSRLNQAAVVGRYGDEVDHSDPSAQVQLRRARRYNAALSSGAIVAANTNVPTGSGTSRSTLDYWKLLTTESGMMSRIQIPSIDVDLPIYHGTADSTLLQGAGHLQGTSLPVGGRDTHAVITGHRGLAEATMFTDLDRLHNGDRFTITTFGLVLSYEVFQTQIVEPDDTRAIGQVAGKDLVTLVTCTPLGINSHRMLVTARRVTPTSHRDIVRATAGPPGAPFPWFAPIYLAAVLAIALYARWAGMVQVPASTT